MNEVSAAIENIDNVLYRKVMMDKLDAEKFGLAVESW